MTFSALILRSSDPTGLLVWCVVGFCAGIGLFFYGFRLLQRRRLILDTPFSKIRSAAMGMVEISGLAVGPYTMVAPITAVIMAPKLQSAKPIVRSGIAVACPATAIRSATTASSIVAG